MSLLQAYMGSEEGKRLLLEWQPATERQLEATTTFGTFTWTLRPAAAQPPSPSGSVRPVTHNTVRNKMQIQKRKLKQINLIALYFVRKRISIHTKWGRTNIHKEQTTRTKQNDVHRRPQLQQLVTCQQTSIHEHCRTTYPQKTASTAKCKCKGNRFPLDRHQGVLHAPMLLEDKTLHPAYYSAKQWHIRDNAHTIKQ